MHVDVRLRRGDLPQHNRRRPMAVLHARGHQADAELNLRSFAVDPSHFRTSLRRTGASWRYAPTPGGASQRPVELAAEQTNGRPIPAEQYWTPRE